MRLPKYQTRWDAIREARALCELEAARQVALGSADHEVLYFSQKVADDYMRAWDRRQRVWFHVLVGLCIFLGIAMQPLILRGQAPDSSWLAPAKYHLATGREWVGCAPLGLDGPVYPVEVRSSLGGATNPKGLCPEGVTLVHTHFAWDKCPSRDDCKNAAARRAEYDVIVLADTTRFRVVRYQYQRCP